MSTTSLRIRTRFLIGASLAAVALATGAMSSVASPVAHAKPISEKTIKKECKDAGGTYGTTVKQGTRFSTCSYNDIDGDNYVDYYADGNYYSTWPH
jgi:hypothetical protein